MDEAHNSPLWRCSTMKVGGDADQLYHPRRWQDLVSLIERLKKEGQPWHVLGGGSNTLISSDGVEGAVIRMTMMTSLTNPEPDLLEADAGTRLPHLAKYAASLGLSGLEFAVGIPGTVGGAVVMNAGAHGSCMANVVESATVMNCETGTVETFTREQLKFEYRNSVIDPSKYIVLSARLKMKPDEAAKIQAKTHENEDYRWRTQPLGWPNLGSTFKNPEPTRSAGFLLDQSGAKDLKEGHAAVSAIHANFVINLGGAHTKDIVQLLHRMQATVEERYSIRLHPEWKTLGRFNVVEREIWNGTT